MPPSEPMSREPSRPERERETAESFHRSSNASASFLSGMNESQKNTKYKYKIVSNLGRGAFGQVDLISNGKKRY